MNTPRKPERMNISKLNIEHSLKDIIGIEHNDNWAEVELYRWQHGFLPGEEGKPSLKLDVAHGLRAMANAFSGRDPLKWPAPFNIASVLAYTAKLIEQGKKS